jgi:hypothetical protein
MASKARDLSNFISVATIDATEIATNAITTDKVADTAITHAKLHTTMDLSGKTVSFAVNQISGNAIDGGVISNFTSTGIDDNATSTAITIDASENVTLANGAILKVKDAFGDTAMQFNVLSSGSNSGRINVDPDNTGANSQLSIYIDNSEKMVVDSSGNVLVGKSTADFGTSGTVLFASGEVDITNSGTPLYLNRLSSDGAISSFYKDGTSVGSIGTLSSVGPYIGNGDTALMFRESANSILPWSPQTNYYRDSAIDLGDSGDRFKDLHLSGGVYLGGTGSANKLDDYEEGTWTPTASSLGSSWTVHSARYTKTGNLVHVQTYIDGIAGNGTSAAAQIGGLPFNLPASAWAVGSLNSANANADKSNFHVRMSQSSNVVDLKHGRDTTLAGTDIDASHIIFSLTYFTS